MTYNQKRAHSDMCTIPDSLSKSKVCKGSPIKINQGIVWKNKGDQDGYRRLLFQGPENDNTCLVTDSVFRWSNQPTLGTSHQKLDTYVVDRKHCRNFLNLHTGAWWSESKDQRRNSYFLVLKIS